MRQWLLALVFVLLPLLSAAQGRITPSRTTLPFVILTGDLTMGSGTQICFDVNQVCLSNGGAGILAIASVGNTNNENLLFDLETTPNTATLSSSTGVDALAYGLLDTWTIQNWVVRSNANILFDLDDDSNGSNTFQVRADNNDIVFNLNESGNLALGVTGITLIPDTDGSLTTLGRGDGFDENHILDLDNVENTWSYSSSTGVVQATFSGIGLLTPHAVEVVTGTNTTTALESGKTFTNTGDADGSTATLVNDPLIGTNYRWIAMEAQTIIISPSAGETIEADGSVCSDVRIGASVGESITLEAAEGGAGGVWVPTASHGGFTCTP